MRHPCCRGLLALTLAVCPLACQKAAEEPRAAPSAQPAPPKASPVAVEPRVRAALAPLAPELRRCRDLLATLNAALAAQKNEAKAAQDFNACQAPVNEKTLAVVQELKKEGLAEDRIMVVVNQWRNEQMSDKAPGGKP
jgi:hypothetical protein